MFISIKLTTAVFEPEPKAIWTYSANDYNYAHEDQYLPSWDDQDPYEPIAPPWADDERPWR